MDFTTMGTVGSYVKQKNLSLAANYKTKTGYRLTDENGNFKFNESQTMDIKKKSDEEVRAAKLSNIKQKLASGHKLSNEDLSYLQQREPKTYKRAKHAEETREELRGELRKAKTKQEARQAVTQAMIKASAEASADIAACKSDSGSSSDIAKDSATSNEVKNFMFDVDKNSTDFSSNTTKIFNESEYQNLDSDNEYFSWNNETEEEFTEEEDYSTGDFYDSQNLNEGSADIFSQNDSESPQDVMKRFIMTIRAIESEWAQFTRSREYDQLPNNKIEEDLLNRIGNRNRKEIERPNARMWGAVTAYRNSMMFGLISSEHIEK